MDLAIITGVMVVAVIGRARLDVFESSADTSGSVMTVGPLIIAGWLLTTFLLRGYRENVFGAGTDELKRVFNAGLVTAGLVGVGCYLAKFPLSRGFFGLTFLVGIPCLLVGRLLLRHALHTARRRGALRQRVLIVGGPSHVDEIAGVLAREDWLGYDVVGALTPEMYPADRTASGIEVIGNAEDLTSLVDGAAVDVIFFAGGALDSGNQMRRLVWDLERHHVQLIVAPSVTDVSSERIRVRPVGGLPLMHISPPTARDAASLGKRAFDVLGAFALILMFLPLLAFVAVNVWAHDRGPVLFRQIRTGRNGQVFNCLKFRTMVVDAEARLAELHAEQAYEGGMFKMKDDPRITRPGRWLRRFSLDELPQLFNVLRGEMSLVGPRPSLPAEVELYRGDTGRRLHVRPGLTGLWQVSGRSDLSFEEAVRLDLYYVDNWSMMQDVSILVKTVSAVFTSRGAY
ncbi:unannotated protein [freshwater metagenome]|uniref:Unannotated protein n=1 Tax=freshwater metagenome TaxID=449393 RepID=A0A6J6PG27_9ZZZZ